MIQTSWAQKIKGSTPGKISNRQQLKKNLVKRIFLFLDMARLHLDTAPIVRILSFFRYGILKFFFGKIISPESGAGSVQSVCLLMIFDAFICFSFLFQETVYWTYHAKSAGIEVPENIMGFIAVMVRLGKKRFGNIKINARIISRLLRIF